MKIKIPAFLYYSLAIGAAGAAIGLIADYKYGERIKVLQSENSALEQKIDAIIHTPGVKSVLWNYSYIPGFGKGRVPPRCYPFRKDTNIFPNGQP
jgi:hypothetical protein